MKRILVTGGAGFVGAPLSRALKKRGHGVLVYDNFFNGKRENVEGLDVVEGDVRDYDLLQKTLSEWKPAVIFHLAALHFIPYCDAHPVETVEVNTLGTATLLDLLRKQEAERVISISTAAVYSPSDTAHSEDGPVGPLDIYGLSKLQMEGLLKLYHFQTGRSAINVRLFNVYASNDTNPHVLPDILKQIPVGDEIELGNVEPKRDYIYVADVVEGLIALMEYDAVETYKCFNLGTGKEYSVTEIVEALSEILGRDLRILSHSSRQRKTDRGHLLADNRRIVRETGWRPRFSLRRGLEETLRTEGLLASPE